METTHFKFSYHFVPIYCMSDCQVRGGAVWSRPRVRQEPHFFIFRSQDPNDEILTDTKLKEKSREIYQKKRELEQEQVSDDDESQEKEINEIYEQLKKCSTWTSLTTSSLLSSSN